MDTLERVNPLLALGLHLALACAGGKAIPIQVTERLLFVRPILVVGRSGLAQWGLVLAGSLGTLRVLSSQQRVCISGGGENLPRTPLNFPTRPSISLKGTASGSRDLTAW